MKKFFAILFFAGFVLTAQAQRQTKTTGLWGYGGGIIASFYQENSQGYSLNTGPMAGIEVKTKYEYGRWGWAVAAGFEQKGAKFRNAVYHDHAKLNFAVIKPGMFLYFPLRNNDDIVTEVGFYGGYNIKGNIVSDSANYPIKFGENWKKPDFGMFMKITYDIKNVFQIGLGGDGGFINTYTYTDFRGNQQRIRNLSASLFVGVNVARLFGVK